MRDARNKLWTRDGTRCTCEDGRQRAIVPEMTDDYILSVINAQYLPSVPVVVDMAQARLALLEAGLLHLVESAIDGMGEPQRTAARIEWEYRTTVRRDSALTQQLGAALGLSAEQIDALFIRAQEL